MVALAVALLLTVVFAAGVGSRRLGPNWLVFFGLVLLAAWAGGVWIPPVGPALLGVYWMPFLFVALILAVLWVLTTRARRTGRREVGRVAAQEEMQRPVGVTFSVLVWILMIGLAVAILLAYV